MLRIRKLERPTDNKDSYEVAQVINTINNVSKLPYNETLVTMIKDYIRNNTSDSSVLLGLPFHARNIKIALSYNMVCSKDFIFDYSTNTVHTEYPGLPLYSRYTFLNDEIIHDFNDFIKYAKELVKNEVYRSQNECFRINNIYVALRKAFPLLCDFLEFHPKISIEIEGKIFVDHCNTIYMGLLRKANSEPKNIFNRIEHDMITCGQWSNIDGVHMLAVDISIFTCQFNP